MMTTITITIMKGSKSQFKSPFKRYFTTSIRLKRIIQNNIFSMKNNLSSEDSIIYLKIYIMYFRHLFIFTLHSL